VTVSVTLLRSLQKNISVKKNENELILFFDGAFTSWKKTWISKRAYCDDTVYQTQDVADVWKYV